MGIQDVILHKTHLLGMSKISDGELVNQAVHSLLFYEVLLSKMKK